LCCPTKVESIFACVQYGTCTNETWQSINI
jgi:hypothetical protein